MSWIIHDPDEWETVIESKSYGRDPFGNPIGSCSMGQRRRSPEEIARIKDNRRREHEAKILAEADAIRARRISETV